MNSPEWSNRTFGNEDHLPRVPLPSLDASCELFLQWCAPLLTPEQLAQTRAAVETFRRPNGPGPRLHAELERFEHADGVRSWLDRFWPRRYLGRRDRIALNANFFFLLEDAPTADLTGDPQLSRAAGLIAAALEYKLRLDVEAIPPIVLRGQPLSMEQNKYLFSETRIPGLVQDTVRVPYSEDWPGPSRARHIVVFVRGHAVRMDVLGADGAPYTMDDLVAGLREVRRAAATPAPPGTSVGHLTTKARAEWATSRTALLALDPANAAALDTIETALFCVCLEDASPRGATATDDRAAVRAEDAQYDLDACDRLLHGDSANRWFDKAVSFIVFPDGSAGMNCEHCGLDGTTVLAFVDTMLSAPAAELSRRSGARSQGVPAVAPVPFVLDDTLRADIAGAGADFAAYSAATASAIVDIEGFGSDRIKQLGMSPDGFAQMAFQLAHQRAKGFIGATYESIATRQYRNGRTEAMRVVTPQVLHFVSTMDDPSADEATRRTAFREAAAAHVERAQQCQRGEAPEQHLWELLLIQNRQGAQLGVPEPPELYATPGWLIMRDDYLSTSSPPSLHVRYFGFGSTSGHCIGVAYHVMPQRVSVYLSTPRAVAAQMDRFADELRTAVAQLHALLATDPHR